MGKEKVESKSTTDDVKKEETKPAPPPPPPKKVISKQKLIEIYSKRLERSLNTSSNSQIDYDDVNNKNEEIPAVYSNPVKVVRRWLSSTSILTMSVPSEDKKVDDKDKKDDEQPLSLLDIQKAIENLYEPSSIYYSELQSMLSGLVTTSNDKMETDDVTSEPKKKYYLKNGQREVQAWLMSLIIRLLYRQNNYKAAFELSTKSLKVVQNDLLSSKYPSTSLYPLLARLYRYHCLIAEYGAPNTKELLHESLISAHRIACLHLDIDTQSTILNLLLRSLLASHQIEQAQKLLSNSTFPDTASNNQTCRHLYYSGRVQALRLEYTTSYSNLSTCLRKAPTSDTSKGIVGFRIEVTRLLSIVQLLMGDIPPRTLFTSYKELTPYLKLTQAVRKGDLHIFNDTVSKFRDIFIKDQMLTLISRLEHSVVKAGLRKLYLSYSKISLSDIATRLALPSATTAEFIVAKAIKDGVIDATIDHENQYVYSHDTTDIYVSMEPCSAFHRRIAYCLTMHNDAVRGMRFLPDAYKKTLEDAGSAINKKDGDEKTDEEKAKEEFDEFDDDF